MSVRQAQSSWASVSDKAAVVSQVPRQFLLDKVATWNATRCHTGKVETNAADRGLHGEMHRQVPVASFTARCTCVWYSRGWLHGCMLQLCNFFRLFLLCSQFDTQPDFDNLAISLYVPRMGSSRTVIDLEDSPQGQKIMALVLVLASKTTGLGFGLCLKSVVSCN